MARIDEIRERAERSTKGEWVVEKLWRYNRKSGAYDGITHRIKSADYEIADANIESDAEFIRHSKSDIEYLLSELDRLNHIVEANKMGNEPLTVEELKQMDGEPVYISFVKSKKRSRWVISRGIEDSQCGIGSIFRYTEPQQLTANLFMKDNGTKFNLYRRKPEGGEGGQHDKQ